MSGITTANYFPPAVLLSDEDALRWLIKNGKIDPESAQKIVRGCRAAFSMPHGHAHENQCVHALDYSTSHGRLLSRVGHPFALNPRPDEKKPSPIQTFIKELDFPENFSVMPGDYGDVGSFAYALFKEYAIDPFDGFTISTPSVCCADEQILLNWRKDVIEISHKNVLAFSYGAVPKFGAFLLGVTKEAA